MSRSSSSPSFSARYTPTVQYKPTSAWKAHVLQSFQCKDTSLSLCPACYHPCLHVSLGYSRSTPTLLSTLKSIPKSKTKQCIFEFERTPDLPNRIRTQLETHQLTHVCCWITIYDENLSCGTLMGAIDSNKLTWNERTQSTRTCSWNMEDMTHVVQSVAMKPWKEEKKEEPPLPPLKLKPPRPTLVWTPHPSPSSTSSSTSSSAPRKRKEPPKKHLPLHESHDWTMDGPDVLPPPDLPSPIPKHIKPLSTTRFTGYLQGIILSTPEQKTWTYLQQCVQRRLKLCMETPDQWTLRVRSKQTDSLTSLLCLTDGMEVEADALGFYVMQHWMHGVHDLWVESELRLWNWRRKSAGAWQDHWFQTLRHHLYPEASPTSWVGTVPQLNILIQQAPLTYTLQKGQVQADWAPLKEWWIKGKWIEVLHALEPPLEPKERLYPPSFQPWIRFLRQFWNASLLAMNTRSGPPRKQTSTGAARIRIRMEDEVPEEEDEAAQALSVFLHAQAKDGVLLPPAESATRTWQEVMLPPCLLRIHEMYKQAAPVPLEESMEDLDRGTETYMKNDSRFLYLMEFHKMKIPWHVVEMLLDGPWWTPGHQKDCENQWKFNRSYVTSQRYKKDASSEAVPPPPSNPLARHGFTSFSSFPRSEGPWTCYKVQDRMETRRFCPFHTTDQEQPLGDIEDTLNHKKLVKRACREHIKQRLRTHGLGMDIQFLPHYVAPSELGNWLVKQFQNEFTNQDVSTME